MILSVEEFTAYVPNEIPNPVLEGRLQALELLIRAYTHNNFQKRGCRTVFSIESGILRAASPVPFRIGDTVQITDSAVNGGLYTVTGVDGQVCRVAESIMDESVALCTKVEYPMDIKMGVVNMLKWDLENRDKVGIQSETISRHSVTYFNMDGENSRLGYPKSLTGFLKPYMRARF